LPRAFGDEVGLVWQEPLKVKTTMAAGPPVAMPETDWMPPQEYPDLSGAKKLGLDLETKDEDLKAKGPGPRREGNYVVGASLSTGDQSWYFPFRHEGGGNLDPDMTIRFLQDTIGGFTGTLYGAQMSYDIDWGMNLGIDFGRVKRFVDVTLAEPLLDENLLKYGLDAVARRHMGADAGKFESVLGQALNHFRYNGKRHLWKLPARFVGEYAEGDAHIPIELFDNHLGPALEREGLTDIFDIESRLILLLVQMRRQGVRVETNERVLEVTHQLNAQIKQQQDRINDAVGFQVGLNNAGGTLAAAFDKLGIPYPIKEKTGNASFQKAWLAAHDHWFPKAVAEARQYDKVEGTFVRGHLGTAIDGRIHTTFNQLRSDDRGAVSGRFSSTDPNLQNIPSRDPVMAPLIRSLFLPEPGESWFQFDWSQIEYRLLGHYAAGESGANLRKRYNDDPTTDFHALCGELAGMDGVDPKIRKKVKNVNFGVVYGAGEATTAATMGVDIEEAREFLKNYHTELPFAKATMKAAMGTAQRRGYIYTLLHRRAHFPLWEPSDYVGGKKNRDLRPLPYDVAVEKWGARKIKRAFTYSALNRLLQGSAADVMKKAMVDVWESGLCGTIGVPLLTVHDELDFSADPHDEHHVEALREVKHIMENCVQLSVPMMADVEYGPNWGNLKDASEILNGDS
jgi:DNA polymerase I-like protein with 3'-5' exonuclease and polymerase domains